MAQEAPKLIRGPQDCTALVGDRVLLKATYSGHPEPSVKWKRAGKELKNDERTSITSGDGVSCLLLQKITTDDSGKYDISVENEYGNDCDYSSVAVEGPPDSPSGTPTITAFPDAVSVAWSSSPYDGGKKVLGYILEFSLFGSDIWTTAVENCSYLSYTIRNLQPGGRYVFRVRATNIHGVSKPSLVSDIVQLEEHNKCSSFEPRLVVTEPGVAFQTRYEVQEELGKGRFGVVHKVVDRSTNQKLAAKFIRCRTQKDKDKVQDEIDIMNLLRHQKLLQLAAAFANPKEMIMIMEYISGGELFERVVADDFTLTEKDCILFMRQICEGVAYMHSQNIVHLDLKPENIMCHTRTSHEIKIIDFGLAQKINPHVPVRVLFGTPEFIPPEIINYEPIGVKSDMWSLGVICYVLLSGLSPFMGENDSETFANITRADYDFEDEAFNTISQDARDFIGALLLKRKEERLPAELCLKHVWLDPENHQKTVVLSTDKLKKFIIRRKWQKTGNAIRALGRMTNLSNSRRNSAINNNNHHSSPTTPRSSFSGILLSKISSVEEEFGASNNNNNKVTEDADADAENHTKKDAEYEEDILTQLPKEQHHRVKKEVRTRACSERSDSGISDCSIHNNTNLVQVQQNSGNSSTPLLVRKKKLPIDEEENEIIHYVSSVSINLTASALHKEINLHDDGGSCSEESDAEGVETTTIRKFSGRLGSKIENFNASISNNNNNKNKSPLQSAESLKRLSAYSRSVQDTIKKFDLSKLHHDASNHHEDQNIVGKPPTPSTSSSSSAATNNKVTIHRNLSLRSTAEPKINNLVKKLENNRLRHGDDEELLLRVSSASPTMRFRSPCRLNKNAQVLINKEIMMNNNNNNDNKIKHLVENSPKIQRKNENFQKVAAFWNSPKT